MAGRVGQGLNADGLAYGYAPAAGDKGTLQIVESEAAIVRRIFAAIDQANCSVLPGTAPQRHHARNDAYGLKSAARHRNDLACNSRAGLGGKEDDSLGDVFALGPAFQIFGFHRCDVRRRIHKPGRHGIDPDCEISSLQRQRSRQSLNSRLGAVIGHHVRLGKSGTGEVDDHSATGFLHVREY